MKKSINILGIFVLSAGMFSMSNRIKDGKTINLNSLIALNTANAEDGGGGHKCYDSFVLGNTYTSTNCSGCKKQKYDQAWDFNTCP